MSHCADETAESRVIPQSPLVAFVGTPNCGKSTLFNVLTGLRQKVGNFPGVTVNPALGTLLGNEKKIRLIDLPGIYSLSPKSPDEALTASVLKGESKKIEMPDAAVFVINGTNLEKSLFLFSQFAALKIPSVVVVTMIDEIKSRGGIFDDIELEHELGVPVLSVVGHKGVGVDEIKEQLCSVADFAIPQISSLHDDSIEKRHLWARELSKQVLKLEQRDAVTERLDRFFLHPFFGPMIFLAVMLLFFQSIFTWATPLMDFIDGGFSALADFAATITPEGIIQNFVTKGLIGGVGSVVIFLPQILILYLFITLLEECGYLARGAFLVDRIFGVFGLQGRSFIPILGSFACAIPGIMSARIIPNEKDRLTTMLIAPLMTCSARLPIYALLIAAFVPTVYFWGFLSLQALVLFGLYALAAVSGLVMAWLFKKTIFKGSKLPFLMEFPPYRMPSFKSVMITLYNRGKEFLQSAGTVILVFSVILWALTEFPRAEVPEGMPQITADKIQLEQSIAGQAGKLIEPLFKPLGFDWKISVGVIGSFAAREMFVSVMGQLYAADVTETDATLREVLKTSMSLPVALSVLAFYVYALQCMSTIAVLKRETGGWKWPAFAFGYTFLLAYGVSFLVYQVSRGIF
ncbi:MAG TPA: ferrous iron transport protein B [Patescibacteria group bacterium]|nr:ferrous iron transport protein B [Patescibacteria group bacterium]